MAPEKMANGASSTADGTEPSTSTISHRLATVQQLAKLITTHQAFLFDCDGCLWTGNTVVPGAPQALAMLRALGKRIVFVTNNATHSRATLHSKIQAMGIQSEEEEVLGSAFAAAAYLRSRKFRKKVYVIGEQGLVDELQAHGIRTVGGPDHSGAQFDWGEHDPHLEVDKEIGAVVVGLDRQVSYYKIQYALTCLLENKGCLFLATNRDSRGNFSTRQEWAGAGTMVGALAAASEMEPVVVGKPSPFLLDHICRTAGMTRSQLCMVGDRLDTDIEWAQRHGMSSLLVLTGVTSHEALPPVLSGSSFSGPAGGGSGGSSSAPKPTLVMRSVADLLQARDLARRAAAALEDGSAASCVVA